MPSLGNHTLHWKHSAKFKMKILWKKTTCHMWFHYSPYAKWYTNQTQYNGGLLSGILRRMGMRSFQSVYLQMNRTKICSCMIHLRDRNPLLKYHVGCMQNIFPVKIWMTILLGMQIIHVKTMLIVTQMTSHQLKHGTVTSLQKQGWPRCSALGSRSTVPRNTAEGKPLVYRLCTQIYMKTFVPPTS
jgi:hypothetical protein